MSTQRALEKTRARYEAALQSLVDDIRQDPNILSAILCGSLSHDQVWEKSDIDLVLVSADGVKGHNVALVADDINVHTSIMPRSEFKQHLDSATRNSFGHSLFAKARLIYSRDPSIEQMFAELDNIGARDTQMQQMQALSGVLGNLYKAQKWFEVKGDLDYAALWILFATTNLAQMEVGRQGKLIAREVIKDAMELNPELFRITYTDLLNKKKTKKAIATALDTILDYLNHHQQRICQPVLDYLMESGEPRSMTEIDHYFQRNHNLDSVLQICEWLSDCGVIDKVATPVKLTNKSHQDIEELAFFYFNPAI
jgi:predicted nucleotidyltransferase